MAKEEEIKRLLAARKETKNVDYKGPKSWGEMTKDEKHGIIKDILGMSNTRDGGTLIFGVRDDDCEFVGVPNEKLAAFDQTDINNLLENFTEPKHYCIVQIVDIDGTLTAIIEVPEFKDEPIICKKDRNSSKKPSEVILRRGAIYVRNGKAETVEINTVEDMREFIGRALRKKGDWLLREIKTIIEGRPLKAVESDEGLYAEGIRKSNEEIDKNIGNDFPHWELYVYPVPYQDKRVADRKALKRLVTDSAVHGLGWDFPLMPEANSSYCDNGWQSFALKDVQWGPDLIRMKEGFRVYTSGLFFWKGVLRVGGSILIPSFIPEGSEAVFFSDIIYSVTGYLNFVKRFFEDYEPETVIVVKIGIHGVAGKYLTDTDIMWAARLELSQYRATENTIYCEIRTTVAELNGSYLDMANDIARDLFLNFKADDITEGNIKQVQVRWPSN